MPYEIRYNSRTKKYVVFSRPKTKGLWRILASFPSRSQAKAYVKSLGGD
ncbi:MAG: hypothetical protein JRD89_01355 [Deltaproteobacteria bacterium]|nr:hypothetical protein [Deltaproteobacteria bacterium]